MSKVFKKVKSFALPAAMLAFPGMGTALGAALGATGAGATALGSGLMGAASGALGGGGLKGAALGGALGGLGGYASAGGFSGAGSTGSELLTQGGGIAGTPLATSGLQDITQPLATSGMSSGLRDITSPIFYSGTSALPALSIGSGSSIPASSLSNLGISSASNSIGSRLGDIFGGQQGAFSNADLINIYTGVQGTQTYKDLAKAQLRANQQAMSNLSPYMATGASANQRLASLLGLTGDDNEDILERLRSTPGYQFRMKEGQSALDRNLAARGKYFSGEALKESQKFGQGLADQTYNDLLKNLASQSSQGLSAAGQGGLYSLNAGDIEANRILSESNLYNELLNRQLNPVRY